MIEQVVGTGIAIPDHVAHECVGEAAKLPEPEEEQQAYQEHLDEEHAKATEEDKQA